MIGTAVAARARGGAAARAALAGADDRVRRAARRAAGRGQGGARRPLRARVALPVRRRTPAFGRLARARAQRRRRRELALVPGQRAHRRRVGHVPRRAAARRASGAARARARKRRRIDRARALAALYPRMSDRRRGDRSRGDGGGAALSRSRQHPAAARRHRGRPRVPPQHREALRPDRDRRLPAALHPVPGGDARVFLRGALAPDAGWMRRAERRAPARRPRPARRRGGDGPRRLRTGLGLGRAALQQPPRSLATAA